ncbi:MAG: FAD-binding oxidoreductase [Thermodesulfobacteriota bacterium]
MSRENINTQIDGYAEIQHEIAVLEKYALDRGAERGQVRRAIDWLHPKTLNLRVSEIREETESTSTLRLVSRDGYLPPFQAGQYINLFVEIDGVRTSRPYSISSSPTQLAYYDITVRRVDDGFVSSFLLDEVSVGADFQSTSPSGQFYYNPLFHGDDLVFIAGGSGITPFMSMIREMSDLDLNRCIQLIYGNRSSQDMIFNKKIEKRSVRHGNLSVHTVISEPEQGYKGLTGFITADLITELVDNIHEKMIYVCGPEAMYTFVLAELAKLDIPKRRIRVEVFGPPSDVTCQPGWPEGLNAADSFSVALKGHATIQARAGEPLMNSLERAGIVLETSCRSGECSLCRTKLILGKVFQPKGVKLRKSDRAYGYIHPCMAYPLQDLEIRI